LTPPGSGRYDRSSLKFHSAWQGGRLAVLILVAGFATAQQPSTCSDWQSKFYGVRATWLNGATSRAEVERSFGTPARVETSGPCAVLHYAAPGCSCTFAVCSAQTVVSKTLTVGAAAVPAFITTEPGELAKSMAALEGSLKETQGRLAEMQQAITELAPAPVPTAIPPPPPAPKAPPAAAKGAGAPAAHPQCAALTGKGIRCLRPVVAGTAYCWQHRR
jgi:hypothetical protein